MKNKNSLEKFSLSGQVVIITGGAGLLGNMHAEAVLEADGCPVLLDINKEKLLSSRKKLEDKFEKSVFTFDCNITEKKNILTCYEKIIDKLARIDCLINNAANDPKVSSSLKSQNLNRFEDFSLEKWTNDFNVSLTGAFLCTQVFGTHMARKKKGVILNIASDLSVISPDQRIYELDGVPPDKQPVKAVSYSVVKTALIGLTKYLATYWANSGVRVNAISPSGVFNNQDNLFVEKLVKTIPLARMAEKDEYKSSIIYLLSDASSYLTGFNLVVDGGRSCW